MGEKYGTSGEVINDNKIWRMRFACWISNAKNMKKTHTHTEYVILNASPLQQLLRKRASIYVTLTLNFSYRLRFVLILISSEYVSKVRQTSLPTSIRNLR